mmetsp:Transcript_7522/g.13104  ORF Transcript_7522/g.13104 Transcript_7522/m.13104 type:complete len:125 (-) Transcript_7522:289-663(-)
MACVVDLDEKRQTSNNDRHPVPTFQSSQPSALSNRRQQTRRAKKATFGAYFAMPIKVTRRPDTPRPPAEEPVPNALRETWRAMKRLGHNERVLFIVGRAAPGQWQPKSFHTWQTSLPQAPTPTT